MSEVTVTMEFDRETKRTRRYAEQSDDPVIGTLYVPKSTLAEALGDPEPRTITVTVAAP